MFNIKPATVVRQPVQADEATPSAEQLQQAFFVLDGAAQALPAWQSANRERLIDSALSASSMAAALRKYGRYASAKQQAFAASLVERAGRLNTPAVLPGTNAAPARPEGLPLPDLFAVMQKHAEFYVDDLKISRKNQDSLCWLMWHNVCVGKIEQGVATLFYGRLRNQLDSDGSKVVALLHELEANPLAAAMKYGKLSGRCCSCGRDLTDPDSIEAGIGPVCAEKFA